MNRHVWTTRATLFWICSVVCLFLSTSVAMAQSAPGEVQLEEEIVRLSDDAQFAKAATVAEKLVALRQSKYGPNDRRTAIALTSVGRMKLEVWDLPGAATVLRRAVNLLEGVPGAEGDLGNALCALADLYTARAEFARARSTYSRAIALYETVKSTHDSEWATAHMKVLNLAIKTVKYTPHQARHKMQKDEPLGVTTRVDVALAVKRHQERGELRAIVYDARVRCSLSHYLKEAQACIKEAQEAASRVYGPKHPEHGRLLLLLARVSVAESDLKAKVPGFFRKAEEKLLAALGPDHPEMAELYNDWAISYTMHPYGGEGPEFLLQALELRQRAEEIEDRYLDKLLELGTDAEKVAYARLFERGVDVSIGIYHGGENMWNRNHLGRARRAVVTAILRRKGRVLEMMTENLAFVRESQAPEARTLLNELVQSRRAVSRHIVAGPRDGNSNRFEAELSRLQDDADNVEVRVNKWVTQNRPRSRERITLEKVQAAIPEDAALIEYYRYSKFDRDFHFMPLLRHAGVDRSSYITFLIRSKEDPQVISASGAPSAAEVEKSIAAYRRYAMDPNAEIPKLGSLDIRELFELPSPGSYYPDKEPRHLIISPDGAYNTLPFAILPIPLEPKHLLIDNYAISYLSSGRDLLRPFSAEANKTPPVIVANPNYDTFGSTGAPEEPRDKRLLSVLSRLHFPSLEGTAEEASSIATFMGRPTMRVQNQATESAIFDLHGPSILHVATHGFFIDPQGFVARGKNRAFVLDVEEPHALPPKKVGEPKAQKTTKESGKNAPKGTQESKESKAEENPWPANELLGRVNPLHLSGLALAGADVRHGQTDDGILTAYEASMLDLVGTKVVVLSACETGIGEVESGEGVFGLRRSLFMAGAQTQVMSLWQVDDAATSALMSNYYKFLLQNGLGRTQALRNAQLALRRNRETSHPYYWAAFISSGAWGPIDGAPFGPVLDKSEGTMAGRFPPGGARGCGCEVIGEAGGNRVDMAVLLFLGTLVWMRKNAAGRAVVGRV